MKVTLTGLEGLLVIEPQVFKDDRGYFMETFQQNRYREHGINCSFVQDNLSYSVKNTLRGLHYQYPHGQAKLAQVLKGEVFDVAVDIRVGSPTFGRWEGVVLSDTNGRQLYVPEGFAHGFCVLSDEALFLYKCSDIYSAKDEKGLLWSDPGLGIDWPVENPIMSAKDKNYNQLMDMPKDYLPRYGA